MINYIGLDFETTGTDPWGRAAPIQIGVALPNGYVRTELVGKWKWNEWEWNSVSEGIHKITQVQIDQARPAWQVDIMIANDLIEQGVGSRMFNIPVGWNVSGFDRQFITRHFPALNRIFSYRCADLNSMIFKECGTSEQEYEETKKAAKEYAEKVLKKNGMKQKWHDAGYDAAAALVSLQWFQSFEEDLEDFSDPYGDPNP